jgi:hypothetical protein
VVRYIYTLKFPKKKRNYVTLQINLFLVKRLLWQFDLRLAVISAYILTTVVSLISSHGELYSVIDKTLCEEVYQ